jgi:ABC-type cobalamin/Fe3+-siderophores transport system ATPase subunit
MKFEFLKNGEVLLKLKPEDTLEQEFFKALFTGEVDVVNTSSATNSHGEVTIKVKKKPNRDLLANVSQYVERS